MIVFFLIYGQQSSEQEIIRIQIGFYTVWWEGDCRFDSMRLLIQDVKFRVLLLHVKAAGLRLNWAGILLLN